MKTGKAFYRALLHMPALPRSPGSTYKVKSPGSKVTQIGAASCSVLRSDSKMHHFFPMPNKCADLRCAWVALAPCWEGFEYTYLQVIGTHLRCVWVVLLRALPSQGALGEAEGRPVKGNNTRARSGLRKSWHHALPAQISC